MARQFLQLDRRALMTGLGATSVGVLLPAASPAQERPPVAIAARRGTLPLRSGSPETPIWMLEAPELRFRRGENLQVEFANDLAVPVALAVAIAGYAIVGYVNDPERKARQQLVTRLDSGAYALTPTETAVVDRIDERTVVCAGFSGHGFKFAPTVAKAAADLVLGRRPEVDLGPFASQAA